MSASATCFCTSVLKNRFFPRRSLTWQRRRGVLRDMDRHGLAQIARCIMQQIPMNSELVVSTMQQTEWQIWSSRNTAGKWSFVTHYFIKAWLIDRKLVTVPGSNPGLADINHDDLQKIKPIRHVTSDLLISAWKQCSRSCPVEPLILKPTQRCWN